MMIKSAWKLEEYQVNFKKPWANPDQNNIHQTKEK